MTVFLTFGDAGYEEALRRIEKEAAASGFFDRLAIRRPSDLGEDFWRKHGEFVAANRRGYGCWLWKPWLIAEQLRACQPGEILVYADAGCTVRARGRRRFKEYCHMVQRFSVRCPRVPGAARGKVLHQGRCVRSA